MPPANSHTAAEVIAAARKYLGVPFGHQGRARLGDHSPRMDCVGLLFCVGEDLELSDREGVPIRRADHCVYGPQPHNEFIQSECQRRLITVADMKLVPGEVLTLRLPHAICHSAIVTGFEPNPTMIYSLPLRARHGKGVGVVETLLGDLWRSRIAGVFRFPGVDY